MGVTLPRLLAAQEAAQREGKRPKADACVLIFLNGGPSHLDMWDMKPRAGEGIRGQFKPIATSLSGYQICEHLPRLARVMHRSAVVRSMHHSVNNAHAEAVYTSLTGHDRGDGQVIVGATPQDNPAIGSVLAKLRPPQRAIVSHVHLPYITKEGASGPPQPGFFGGYLGAGYDPLFVLKDPNQPNFKAAELTLQAGVSAQRLDVRRKLFRELDRRLLGDRSAVGVMDGLQQRALDILTSKATQQAFRIDQEPAKVREAYGRNIYGQSVLLARRLIEAGTRMATISWAPDANATWDTHSGNFDKLKKTLLPQFDAACSSLIAELDERGMLERTLVAVLGDFGRTPKINGKNAGRDHWNYCYSLMLAGGGIKPGVIYGASDKIGAFPARDPLVPGDIISTIYHCLGIHPQLELRDRLNRPHLLTPSGSVVMPLLA